MRPAARHLLAAVLASCAASQEQEAAEPAPAPDERPPNVVVLMADDLGWGDVGYHGGVVPTPRIDALVRSGLELDRYYAQPVCSVSRAALLTGRDPQSMRTTRNVRRGELGLRLEERLLPAYFRAAGYRTWMIGKWHLGGDEHPDYRPHERGFDSFYGFLGGAVDYWDHTVGRRGELDWWRDDELVEEEGYATDLFADEAVRLVREHGDDGPFVLYLAFSAVHGPIEAREDLLRRLPDPPPGVDHAFGATLAALDVAVGRIVDAIDEAGLAEDTIVLFTSDNGGNPDLGGNNGELRGGKQTLYDGGVRVASTLVWPGTIPAGAKSEQVVACADVLPTLAEMCGLELDAPNDLDGRSRWTELRTGEVTPPRGVVLGNRDLAVLEGRYKLHVPVHGPEELYDVYADPAESNDIAARHPDVVRRLARRVGHKPRGR